LLHLHLRVSPFRRCTSCLIRSAPDAANISTINLLLLCPVLGSLLKIYWKRMEVRVQGWKVGNRWPKSIWKIESYEGLKWGCGWT
jgi:hypothetical protein